MRGQIGVEICEQGVWGECIGAVFPTEEICDGVDNDCDGQIDEDGVCTASEPAPEPAEPEPIATSTEPIVGPESQATSTEPIIVTSTTTDSTITDSTTTDITATSTSTEQ